jgi:hypothetical protein
MPILALCRTLRRASCAHAVSLGQECGRPSSLRIADEHPWSAPVVELADVVNLLAEPEAIEDP